MKKSQPVYYEKEGEEELTPFVPPPLPQEDLPPDEVKAARVGDIVVPLFIPVDDCTGMHQIQDREPLTVQRTNGRGTKQRLFFRGVPSYYEACFFRKKTT